jgi:hypothetical protein
LWLNLLNLSNGWQKFIVISRRIKVEKNLSRVENGGKRRSSQNASKAAVSVVKALVMAKRRLQDAEM